MSVEKVGCSCMDKNRALINTDSHEKNNDDKEQNLVKCKDGTVRTQSAVECTTLLPLCRNIALTDQQNQLKTATIVWKDLPVFYEGNFNYHNFNRHLDLWFNDLQEQESVFSKQISELLRRDMTIKENQKQIQTLNGALSQDTALQSTVELLLHFAGYDFGHVEKYLSELEPLVDNETGGNSWVALPCSSNAIPSDRERKNLYGRVDELFREVTELERLLEDVKVYLNDGRSSTCTDPLSQLNLILQMNGNTMKRIGAELENVENLSLSVDIDHLNAIARLNAC